MLFGPMRFTTAIVEPTEAGDLAMAIMAPLPAPFDRLTTCVAILTCSPEAAQSLCAAVAAGSAEIDKRPQGDA